MICKSHKMLDGTIVTALYDGDKRQNVPMSIATEMDYEFPNESMIRYWDHYDVDIRTIVAE